MKFTILVITAFFTAISAGFAAQPKYGPQATVLSASHDYFLRASAPDFWALIPYYAQQQDGSSCSVATVSMAVNGARAVTEKLAALTTDDELVTQATLVKNVKNKAWHKGKFLDTLVSKNVYSASLDQLGEIAREAFTFYGMPPTSVEVVHAEVTDAMRAKLHAALVENEKSARDFILINFDQKVYTSDESVGHIAPIGAYDEAKKRVLVMDPDRTWYEPYWVSEEVLLQGMATKDILEGKTRGYVWVKF